MKNKLTIVTKMLLDFMFYAGMAVTATLPLSIRFYGILILLTTAYR